MENRVVRTLSDLLRFDTTNPPGNETRCVEYIRDRLAAEGIDSTILESAPGRGSLVARLKGDGSARPLLLMSHIDVVKAEVERWTHPPFAGDVADGYVWGRGAVDMKNLTAIELEIFLELKRRGVPLKRDVILAATADEETGGSMGMAWLAENHFDLVDAEYAINEGGGFAFRVGDRWLFTCQTAEKGVYWVRVRAHGNPGHASMPPASTAVTKLLAAVGRLAQTSLPQHRVATVDSFIRTMAGLMPKEQGEKVLGLLDPATEAEALRALPESLVNMMRSSLRNSVTPTILRAGEKVNVIPSVAEADVDCRILPGQTPADALAEMRLHLGDEVEVETLVSSPPTESGYQTPLFDIIKQVMGEMKPGSLVAPYMITGGTDGRFLAARGVNVYGFVPMLVKEGELGPMQLAHNHDERVSEENMAFGTRALWEIVQRLCAR
ncbi:MAG: M20/M25/M40 family metallo-hydrolase [Chloroflexota bacterium]